MRTRNARYLLIAILGLSLGACSSVLPRGSKSATRSQASAKAAPAAKRQAPAKVVKQSRPVETREAPEAAKSPAPAQKPKVAVVVEGARSAAVRKKIEKMLGEHYDVISTKRYQKTARRLKAKKMKERNVVKVAARLDADAVLHVVLSKKSKKRYKLALRLRDGSTGKTLERFSLDLKGRSLRKSDQRELADKLVAQIGELADEPAPAAEPAPAPAPAPTRAIARTRSKTGSQTRVAELSTDKESQGQSSIPRVTYDRRGQVIDDEVPPGF